MTVQQYERIVAGERMLTEMREANAAMGLDLGADDLARIIHRGS